MSSEPMETHLTQVRPHKWYAQFPSVSGREGVQVLVVGKNPEPLARKLVAAEQMHAQLELAYKALRQHQPASEEPCTSIRHLLEELEP